MSATRTVTPPPMARHDSGPSLQLDPPWHLARKSHGPGPRGSLLGAFRSMGIISWAPQRSSPILGQPRRPAASATSVVEMTRTGATSPTPPPRYTCMSVRVPGHNAAAS